LPLSDASGGVCGGAGTGIVHFTLDYESMSIVTNVITNLKNEGVSDVQVHALSSP
jgi:hypothetical protein